MWVNIIFCKKDVHPAHSETKRRISKYTGSCRVSADFFTCNFPCPYSFFSDFTGSRRATLYTCDEINTTVSVKMSSTTDTNSHQLSGVR